MNIVRLSWRGVLLPLGMPTALGLFVLSPRVVESQGQPAVARTSDEEIEEIVVTGSRLKRRDFDAPSPIATIDREAMAMSGQATLEEALNRMPQVIPDYGRTANNPGDGAARINLRGIGSGRTLVLLNSRRLAPSGVGSAVDVNELPQALMERVEVITGGASTAYGSDAIAGVVNFITRKDFDGFGLDAGVYVTEKGDSEYRDLNLAYGHNFSDRRGNVTVFAGYIDRQPSFAADRRLTEVAWLDTWEGTLERSGSDATPAGVIPFPPVDHGNGPAWTTFEPSGVPREFISPQDLYNFAPANYLQIPLKRYSGGVFLNVDLTDRLETYVEVTISRNEVRQNLAPAPAFMFAQTNLDNPLLTPEARQLFADNYIPDPNDPNLVSHGFRRRLQELGPRIRINTFDNLRVVAGLRGALGDDWDFDFWLTYTNGDGETKFVNDASRSRLQQGMLVDPASGQCFDSSGGCVPLDGFGEGKLSAEGADFVRYGEFVNVTSRTQKMASLLFTGSPANSWAGPIQTAFGIEWRSDAGDFNAAEALSAGDVFAVSGSPAVAGDETIREIYAEAQVPLAQGARFAESLAIEFGGRYSDYEHAGEVYTYKLGAEWQPVASIRFRGMFQRSVRAPNLQEAFEEQRIEQGSYVGFDSSNDPCSASVDPVGNGNAEKCVIQGLPANLVGTWEATPQTLTEFTIGGNPLLVPESADTLTVGVVLNFGAARDWQISFDYFELEVADTIGQVDPSIVCFDPANTSNIFCEDVQRDPASYDVSSVFQPNRNRGAVRTHGIDTQIHFASELPDLVSIGNSPADLNVDLTWTHMTEITTQANPVASVIDCSGRFGWPCGLVSDGMTYPDDRVTANVNYIAGNLGLHLGWRWIARTENAAQIGATILGIGDIDPGAPTAAAKNYLDLGIGYQFSENIHARFTVTNLSDTDAPMMASAVFSNNTDTSMYDIFGRSYALRFSLQY